MNLGIIGSSWISRQFADAVESSNVFQWTALCTRSEENAKRFIRDNDYCKVMFSPLELFADEEIDVVYIASPNSLHYAQAADAIKHDKNVIVEKPAFSNPAEYSAILALLREHPAVRLFEAARNIHTANFQAIRQQLGTMPRIGGATFSYIQYSSKMAAFEDPGKPTPNVFSPKFAGGALQDMGIYVVYDALALFGEPEEALYKPVMLATGVDGSGTGILRYADFDVTLLTSKTYASCQRSEICGERDLISINNGGDIANVFYLDQDGAKTALGAEASGNPLAGEVADFERVLKDPDDAQSKKDYEYWLSLSRMVNTTIWNMRRSAGIVFPADLEVAGR
jgi:predicted dehydrogenase